MQSPMSHSHLTALRIKAPVGGERLNWGTANHGRIMFSITATICASFGQRAAEIAESPGRFWKVISALATTDSAPERLSFFRSQAAAKFRLTF